MKLKTLLLVVGILLSPKTYSSCPGMKGEAAQRCNCHETNEGLPAEAFQCGKDSDCVAIEGPCADWAIVNLNYVKAHRLTFKNGLSSLRRPPEPQVMCRDNTCMKK